MKMLLKVPGRCLEGIRLGSAPPQAKICMDYSEGAYIFRGVNNCKIHREADKQTNKQTDTYLCMTLYDFV